MEGFKEDDICIGLAQRGPFNDEFTSDVVAGETMMPITADKIPGFLLSSKIAFVDVGFHLIYFVLCFAGAMPHAQTLIQVQPPFLVKNKIAVVEFRCVD